MLFCSHSGILFLISAPLTLCVCGWLAVKKAPFLDSFCSHSLRTPDIRSGSLFLMIIGLCVLLFLFLFFGMSKTRNSRFLCFVELNSHHQSIISQKLKNERIASTKSSSCLFPYSYVSCY